MAVWYPLNHRTPVRALYNALTDAGIRDIIACEFLLRPALDPSRLNGCGMLVVNAPYGFENEARAVLEAMKTGLATEDREDMQVHIERLAEE